MQNLAGVPYANDVVVYELTLAEIPLRINRDLLKGEVVTQYEGVLGKFTFRRAWYYWVVNGPTPLAVAQEIFPVQKEYGWAVRAGGDCGNIEPKGYVVGPINEEGETDIVMKMFEDGKSNKEINTYLEEKYKDHPQYVDTYHIDTQDGLMFFVRTLRKHRLDKE